MLLPVEVMPLAHKAFTNYFAVTAYTALGTESVFSNELQLTNSPAVNWARSASTNVAGYRLYSGPASRQYNWSVDVGNVTNCPTVRAWQTVVTFSCLTWSISVTNPTGRHFWRCGTNGVIYSSGDLVNWSPVATVAAPGARIAASQRRQ